MRQPQGFGKFTGNGSILGPCKMEMCYLFTWTLGGPCCLLCPRRAEKDPVLMDAPQVEAIRDRPPEVGLPGDLQGGFPKAGVGWPLMERQPVLLPLSGWELTRGRGGQSAICIFR